MSKFEKICDNLIKNIEKGKRISPLKAIRCKCLDCVCYVPSEVLKCPIPDCSLYNFRFGKNTTGNIVKKKLSEKQLKALKMGRERRKK
uniref:Uncharacterized protein n=1 Tax=viral metagenome TaxID=1070528 RepID=A0A6H1ZJN3_9ZZZZ